MLELQRKRAREEESANVNGSFAEHRNVSFPLATSIFSAFQSGLLTIKQKRIQCLPLRTSPRASQQWAPSSSMVSPSYDSDDHLSSHMSQWSSGHGNPAQQQHEAHINMMDTSQAHQHGLSRLGQVVAESDDPNGRMPTPIQPSFAAQVRGQQCEWAGPGPTVSNLNGVVNMGHRQTGFSDDQYVPRTATSGWQAVQNNRRLPSPISEGDDTMPGHPITPTVMEFDVHGHGNPTPGAEHYEQPMNSSCHEMEHPNAMMDIERQSPAQVVDEDGEPTTPSPRRGHIRSRHTVNNWTWQPGMKKSFSIGYRSDCEKCRLKVPGHFNHIIVS